MQTTSGCSKHCNEQVILASLRLQHCHLNLFHIPIIASQSATARMNTVILPRWKQLYNELLKLRTQNVVHAPIDMVINGSENVRQQRRDHRTITGFHEGFNRQINEHHWAAYFLEPATIAVPT